MRFNRRITTIKAISFDLDDTLYSNRPVMLATDRAMQCYFQQLCTRQLATFATDLQNTNFDHHFWSTFRQQALQLSPAFANDVTEARQLCYQLFFQDIGLGELIAKEQAIAAMKHFHHHRNRVEVPEHIHDFLMTLSKKYPLVAISNGNVDTTAIGLQSYFDYTFHADQYLQQKPANDLFHLAITKLAIKPSELLHVGDCGNADVKGAIAAGCQSAWLNCYDVGKPIRLLANIELNQVTDLAKLL